MLWLSILLQEPEAYFEQICFSWRSWNFFSRTSYLQDGGHVVHLDICSSIRRLLASPPSACDVIGSLYVLQFLIHSTFKLVVLNWVLPVVIVTVMIQMPICRCRFIYRWTTCSKILVTASCWWSCSRLYLASSSADQTEVFWGFRRWKTSIDVYSFLQQRFSLSDFFCCNMYEDHSS